MDGDLAALRPRTSEPGISRRQGRPGKAPWTAPSKAPGRLRRRALQRVAGTLALDYAPGTKLRVVRHRITPANWPEDLSLRIAILADPHAGGPRTPLPRLARAVALCNALEPDLVVLAGDYLADHRFVAKRPSFGQVAEILARARAPLGVHAILGNHDWWECPEAQRGAGLPGAAAEFAAAGLPVMHNEVRRLEHQGKAIWLAGLGSQWAYRDRRNRITGADDLPGTLAAITDDAPAILLAHEPDIFPRVPDRFAVTLSGHTHGGQVRVMGYSPLVPSRFGNRYAYGAIEEEGRHLVVSGGLGNSLLPMRLGLPPEVTLVELGAA